MRGLSSMITTKSQIKPLDALVMTSLFLLVSGCGGEPDAVVETTPAPTMRQRDSGSDSESTPATQVTGGGAPVAALSGKGTGNSWTEAATAAKIDASLVGAAVAAVGAGAGGIKPSETKQGQVAAGFRADPFESFLKLIVPEIPAYTLAIPRRLASPYIPAAPKETDDPLKTKGPIIPLPRRVAGVMYSGAITAILETGDPAGQSVEHTVIRPGSRVPSFDPTAGELTVESMTLRSLILRADDGRTIEVKLSGLSPAVADALRGQFGTGGAGSGGVGAGAGPGAAGGMPGGTGGGLGGRGGKGAGYGD